MVKCLGKTINEQITFEAVSTSQNACKRKTNTILIKSRQLISSIYVEPFSSQTDHFPLCSNILN